MRKALLLSSALTLGILSPALAGGPVVVVVEAPRVEVQKPRSGGLLVPLLLLAVVVAVAAGGDDEDRNPQPSDIRLKRCIRQVGRNHLGLGVHQWRHDGLDGVWEGVMAQEVVVLHPGAIKALPQGYLAVDHAKLELELRRVA